ncbi:UNVERIFIED_CONTAM: hypothetical protein Sradi_7304200 [Sesamum radiatum]|uniref:DUF4218 domain-containing protein n=1 Tax=Sesamum radiatum TaxID=300843 RepID=A0AAW2I7Z7_SESRA
MCHPSDAEAWRHFDKSYPDFAVEPRNVRLALCIDGFAPYGQYGRTYSCWPVILTAYNFSPGMCMKPEYMFLTIVIPGPSNPKCFINIYLEPLIKELLQLWHVGVLTHDHATNQAFMMRAAWMWTINHLPAYGMASGWSTAGIMGCPICMEDTQAFRLQHGRKACYFNCHRQFLPHDHPYRRNKRSFTKNRQERKIARPRLTGDEIHRRVEQYGTAVEKPLTYPPGETKDNLNARKDLKNICNRPELEVDERRPNAMPKAAYTLTKEQKEKICAWVRSLRFPDGYASNIARCVDIANLRVHGMKSHDCHVFMQKLIPVAFRELLLEFVWSALTEVSLLFQVLCSTILDFKKVQELEENVAIIMCNLEKIFPPTFFDSMEHLIVHLPYEARVGGPVQYRWMYPFERFLRDLKKKVKNKAHVEASICEAYIVQKIGWFTSHYFESHVTCKRHRPSRNDELTQNNDRVARDIFNHPGCTSGVSTKRYTLGQERHVMEMYVLCNSEVVAPYYRSFLNELYETYSPDDPIIDQIVATDFKAWFNVVSSYTDTDIDFYGMLKEIIQLDYPVIDSLQVVLFKCKWVDPTRGMKLEEVEPPPKVNTDNQTYNLHDPNGLVQFVDISEAMQHGAGTSRPHDDDEEDEDEEEEDDLE